MAGLAVFQWSGRFPVLCVDLARGEVASALEHARAMLAPSNQPLPRELSELVERAVADADRAALESAVELAASIGYA